MAIINQDGYGEEKIKYLEEKKNLTDDTSYVEKLINGFFKKVDEKNLMISEYATYLGDSEEVRAFDLDRRKGISLNKNQGTIFYTGNMMIHVMKNGSIRMGRSSDLYNYGEEGYGLCSHPGGPPTYDIAINTTQKQAEQDGAVSSFDIMEKMDNNSFLVDYIEEALKEASHLYNSTQKQLDIEKALKDMNDLKNILKESSKTYRDVQLEKDKKIENKKNTEKQKYEDTLKGEIADLKMQLSESEKGKKSLEEENSKLREQLSEERKLANQENSQLREALSTDRQWAVTMLSKIPFFGKRLTEKYMGGVVKALPEAKVKNNEFRDRLKVDGNVPEIKAKNKDYEDRSIEKDER